MVDKWGGDFIKVVDVLNNKVGDKCLNEYPALWQIQGVELILTMDYNISIIAACNAYRMILWK